MCQTFLNINEENSQAVQIYVLLFQTYGVINKMITRGRYFLYDVEKWELFNNFFVDDIFLKFTNYNAFKYVLSRLQYIVRNGSASFLSLLHTGHAPIAADQSQKSILHVDSVMIPLIGREPVQSTADFQAPGSILFKKKVT